jgi:hypothetical protein
VGTCRLCAGPLQPRFQLRLLQRHEVAYFVCSRCGSLQTETPHWLEEAYSQNLSNLDTGAAQRNLRNLAACFAVARVLGLQRLLDIGGGDGLLCRLLRDRGLNCYVRDKYARPTYAQGFDEPDFERPEMVMGFEVFEHLPQPAAELQAFFASGPQAVLISTELHTGQGPDWPYLAPESGQHVFFYSPQALALVAQQQGYTLLLSGEFSLFLKPGAGRAWQVALLKLLLKRRLCRLVAAWLMLGATPGVTADHELQKRRSQPAPPA